MIVVFYYSVTGTNASIARVIGKGLNAEVCEIRGHSGCGLAARPLLTIGNGSGAGRHMPPC